MHVDIFSRKQLQELIIFAKESERLRAHLALHSSYQDKVQRILIGLTQGTYIPPHFHKYEKQWEHFQVIDGTVDLLVFDSVGTVIDCFRLGSDSGALFAKIEPRTIHTLVCRSQEAVILEIKEGPFIESEAKVIPTWAHTENYRHFSRSRITNMLNSLKVGEMYSIE